MIFDKCCDKSLWLIVNSDEKNRDVIVNFLNDIPFELSEKIREALKQFNDYEISKVDILDRDIVDLSEELFLSDHYKYWFKVDMILGTFNIGRSFNGIKDIEITLNLNKKNYFIDVYVLGDVRFGESKIITYELIKTILGDKMVSCKEDNIKRYKKVNIKSISDDIDILDLEKKNCFIRCRKKRNSR